MELLSINPPSDSSQYVVVCICLFQCVDPVVCEQNWIRKQLELLSIKSSKWYLLVCGGLILSLSVCGCIACEQNSIKKQLEVLSNWNIKRYLSVCGGLIISISVCGLIWNEYILIKKQLELMSSWSSSDSCQCVFVFFLSFNVWMLSPVNTIQRKNNWNCWAFKPSSVVSQYVVVSLFLLQYTDLSACEQISMNFKKVTSNPSNIVSICCGLYLFSFVYSYGSLWKEFKWETI